MSVSNHIHFGLVLAGGRSSRMGSDKAMLVKGNVNLLDNAKLCLSTSLCQQVLISRNTEQGIRDRYLDKGPLAGIEAAIKHVPSGAWLTILPVDMPLVRSSDLVQLQKTAQASKNAVYFESHMLPCVVKVTIDLKEFLKDALEGKYKNSIYAMLKTQNAHTLAQDEPLYLTNANTPNDWQAVKTHF